MDWDALAIKVGSGFIHILLVTKLFQQWACHWRQAWAETPWPSRQALFWLLLRCDWSLVQQEDGGGLRRPGHQGGRHFLP